MTYKTVHIRAMLNVGQLRAVSREKYIPYPHVNLTMLSPSFLLKILGFVVLGGLRCFHTSRDLLLINNSMSYSS